MASSPELADWPQSRSAPGARNLLGPILVLVGLAAAFVVFRLGLVSLVDAWATPEYSHGPIIPLISTFLFLREMRHVPPTDLPIRDRWPGFLVTLLGLGVGGLGNLVGIPDIVTYGFIVWVAGMILTSFGLRRGAAFWPAVVHLAFMLPLPQILYWKVSLALQMVSSQIGVWLIRVFDIPVYLDGNIIDLGVYKLQVAEACSGLRYLFPMLSFSFVFAVLYQGPRWHKVALLLAAAPITVLMNSFRIGMIGVLVNSYGIEQAEGFLHAFEGWIIFVACVCILFVMATLLQRLTPSPKPLSETLDIEFTGLDREARRFLGVTPSISLIAAVAAVLAAAGAMAFSPDRTQLRVERAPFATFPMQLDAWRGARLALEPEIERVLAADDYLSALYRAPGAAAPVDLFVAFYHDQTRGDGIHSPAVCLPAGGWEVSAWKPTRIALPSGVAFEVNRAMIQKGTQRQLVYFWFELRGKRTTSDYAAKAMTVIDSVRMGRSDGALARLITPLGPTEDAADADARLQGFMALTMEQLPRFVTGETP